MKFYVRREPYIYDGAEVHIRDNDRVVTFEAKTTQLDPGMYYEPGLRLPDQAAQSLFQALWDAGYRPANGESSMAHVDALKGHLQDMRRLVFAKVPDQESP